MCEDYDRVVESRQTEEEEKVLKSKLGVGESINKVDQLCVVLLTKV